MAGSLMNSFCDYLAVGLYTKFSALPFFHLLHRKALDLSISYVLYSGGTAQAVFLRFYFAATCRTAKFAHSLS